MGDRYLTELADVLRDTGRLEVIEVDGWEFRGRSSGGFDGDRPWAAVWHHTASDTLPENDVGYIVYGCPDAPVANLYLDRDGRVWVCAGGATNTNGKGGPAAVSLGTIPVDQANTHVVGIEAANNGVGQAWPAVQIDSYFTINNALANFYGWLPADCLTHHEWTPGRKIDPATAGAVEGPWRPGSLNTSGTWSMVDIRAEANRRASTPPPIEEDAMYLATLSNGDVVVVGSAVRPVSGDEIGPGGPFASLPRFTPADGSNWHAWLRAGCDEYTDRVM